MIIGSNSAEVTAGFVNARSKDSLLALFGTMNAEAAAAYDPEGKIEFPRMLTLVNTDKVWAEPARFTARAFVKNGAPAYLYLFSYVPAALRERLRFGAPHASEIAYVFNTLADRNGVAVTPADREIARMMNAYWINFAKTGNPNGNGLPNWPVFDANKQEVFECREDGSAGNTADMRKSRLDVIEKLATGRKQ